MRYTSSFRKKNRVLKKVYSIPVLILLLVILFFVLRGTWGVYQRASLSKDKLMLAQVEVTELKKRQENISSKISRLNTNTGIEEEIREKFNVVKEGEEMVVIIDKEKDVEEDLTPKKKSFFEKIFPFLME